MCFASILRKWGKMIQLLLNKTTPLFQLLPMSRVDQSELHIHEVPLLKYPKSHMIHSADILWHLIFVYTVCQ